MVTGVEFQKIAGAGLSVLNNWGIYSVNDIAGKLVDYPIGRGIPGCVSLHRRPSKLGTLAHIVGIRNSKEIYIEAEINNSLNYTEVTVNYSDVLEGYNVLRKEKDSLGNIPQSKTIKPASIPLFKKELEWLSKSASSVKSA